MEYKVVSEINSEILNKKVNSLLKKGYILSGGLNVSQCALSGGTTKQIFAQTLIKPKKLNAMKSKGR